MNKSAVYSWRVSPAIKTALEERARTSGKSLGSLLDTIAEEWLRVNAISGTDQGELQKRVARTFGALRSGQRNRSERTRALVRDRLRRKHA
jgi:hypothetical protein